MKNRETKSQSFPSEVTIIPLPSNFTSLLKSGEKKLIVEESTAAKEFDLVRQRRKDFYTGEERTSNLLSAFSYMAIFIACLGLFGLSSYVIENRTKEIGVRKVNGARLLQILGMINKDFTVWVVISYLVACPIAFIAMRSWLTNFAYRTPLSWWIFAVAGILAGGIAVLTVSWQSWRAASRNPVEALRYE